MISDCFEHYDFVGLNDVLDYHNSPKFADYLEDHHFENS